MFDDLDEWLQELADLEGVKSAVLDPATIALPGVWCRVPSFAADTLADGEYRVDLELHLAVSDQDWKRARAALLALFKTVSTHLGSPRVTATFETLALPDGPAVPALRFPFTVRIVDETGTPE